MKKAYIQPNVFTLYLQTEGMIAVSMKIDSNNTVDTSADGGQLTNKKNPIWGGSEEETDNGFW